MHHGVAFHPSSRLRHDISHLSYGTRSPSSRVAPNQYPPPLPCYRASLCLCQPPSPHSKSQPGIQFASCQLRTTKRANSPNTSSTHTRSATRSATVIALATTATDTTSSMAPSTVQPPSKAAHVLPCAATMTTNISRLSAPFVRSREAWHDIEADATLRGVNPDWTCRDDSTAALLSIQSNPSPLFTLP